MGSNLTVEDRRTIHRMVGLGMSLEEVARSFGITAAKVQRIDQDEFVRKHQRQPSIHAKAYGRNVDA